MRHEYMERDVFGIRDLEGIRQRQRYRRRAAGADLRFALFTFLLLVLAWMARALPEGGW